MKLVEDWKRVLKFSMSVWMQIFGLLVLILPEVWYALTGIDYNPRIAWFAGVFFLIVGIVGRILKQGVQPGREWVQLLVMAVLTLVMAFLVGTSWARAAPATEEQTLEIAVPFIAKFEGKRNEAYLDIVGVPTICYGSTRGVKLGMELTDDECTALLEVEVAEYRTKLHHFFTDATIQSRLPPARDAAYTSTAFNCGIVAIGKSTATRRINTGDITGGCHALTWWNKAGGRVIRGLARRRVAEEELCLR